ncbi:hypothetical protein GGS23DRAFT_318198 [Durotheca rogersii]|uniref:uncharacterized protein n=1 Tax=Durotheca rogersii TaxID=419775 RepID=UPI00221E471E|nr:uncharacterized protein GGS23DRAFT_318198 [Durotheca rogersii]KAI5859452.1 hypothetical protein GGS23DRAFT_318198 [Durotheca rogersii]
MPGRMRAGALLLLLLMMLIYEPPPTDATPQSNVQQLGEEDLRRREYAQADASYQWDALPGVSWLLGPIRRGRNWRVLSSPPARGTAGRSPLVQRGIERYRPPPALRTVPHCPLSRLSQAQCTVPAYKHRKTLRSHGIPTPQHRFRLRYDELSPAPTQRRQIHRSMAA